MQHDAVISLWPSAVEMSADTGFSENTIRAWKRRRSIPAWAWNRVLEAAEKRELDLSLETLAAGARRRANASTPSEAA